MAEVLSIEERVSDLEKQVSLLSNEVWKRRSKPGWVRKILGSMENDPEFAEILNLGREIREAERQE